MSICVEISNVIGSNCIDRGWSYETVLQKKKNDLHENLIAQKEKIVN